MTEMETMAVLDKMIHRIVERFQPDRVILFGSHATGKATGESDIDLLVVMAVEGSRRSKANEIDLALADRTVPIDVVVVTPGQFERERNMIGTIVREAVREGKTIYERAA
jgi:uncharacterized protein